ncbi:uncharacterized protein [Aristolochia californica]|uniref:uncharacterized protein n=1 Tax=Aristolochia californica TaxID=171875 RepID=UPI0035D787A6
MEEIRTQFVEKGSDWLQNCPDIENYPHMAKLYLGPGNGDNLNHPVENSERSARDISESISFYFPKFLAGFSVLNNRITDKFECFSSYMDVCVGVLSQALQVTRNEVVHLLGLMKLLKLNMKNLEASNHDQDHTITLLQTTVDVLYAACCNSILELQTVSNSSAGLDFVDLGARGGDNVPEEPSECIKTAEKLSAVVKHIHAKIEEFRVENSDKMQDGEIGSSTKTDKQALEVKKSGKNLMTQNEGPKSRDMQTTRAKITASKKEFKDPLEICVKDGDINSVMCSYNHINGVPSCVDNRLLSATVRGEWALHGYIVADCDSLEVMHHGHNWLNDEPEDAVAQTFEAGLDLDCGVYYTNYAFPVVQNGRVRETEVDKALRNLYVVLMRLGFFYGSPDGYDSLGKEDVCPIDHIELAARAAREGIVLLQNNLSLPWYHQKMNSARKMEVVFTIYEDFAHYKTGVYKHITGGKMGRPCNFTNEEDFLFPQKNRRQNFRRRRKMTPDSNFPKLGKFDQHRKLTRSRDRASRTGSTRANSDQANSKKKKKKIFSWLEALQIPR